MLALTPSHALPQPLPRGHMLPDCHAPIQAPLGHLRQKQRKSSAVHLHASAPFLAGLSSRCACLQFLGGENMLTGHTNDHWKAVRKAVAPAFSAGNMRSSILPHHHVLTSLAPCHDLLRLMTLFQGWRCDGEVSRGRPCYAGESAAEG